MTRPLYTEARTRLDLAVAALAAAVGVGLPLILAGERLPTVAPAVLAGIGAGVAFGFAVAFLAGPAGGSLSRLWGSTATSGLAATASMTLAGGANVVGLGVGNLIGGEDTSWSDIGVAAGSGAVLSVLPGPTQSSTLNQMQYFNPTSLGASLTTINGRRLWVAVTSGAILGGGIDMAADTLHEMRG